MTEDTGTARDATTLAIARHVAEHWRKCAVTYRGKWVPGELLAHPLYCVLAALEGKSAVPEDFGVDKETAEYHAIIALGFREYSATDAPCQPPGEADEA